MTPTSGHERYEFLDVLRGFALFGIITANMVLYSLYSRLSQSTKISMSTDFTNVKTIELGIKQVNLCSLE